MNSLYKTVETIMNKWIYIFFFFSFSLQAEIYKWTDEKGQLHYSNKKPAEEVKNIENVTLGNTNIIKNSDNKLVYISPNSTSNPEKKEIINLYNQKIYEKKQNEDKLLKIEIESLKHKDSFSHMLRESRREGMSKLQAYQDLQFEIDEYCSKVNNLIQKTHSLYEKKQKFIYLKYAAEILMDAIYMAKKLSYEISDIDSNGNLIIIQSTRMSCEYAKRALNSIQELQDKVKNQYNIEKNSQ